MRRMRGTGNNSYCWTPSRHDATSSLTRNRNCQNKEPGDDVDDDDVGG